MLNTKATGIHRSVPHWRVPHAQKSWVLDKGSLTERLKQASNGNFQVRLKSLDWGTPTYAEYRSITGHRHRSKHQHVSRVSLIREVELLCHGQAWVRARSIIPLTTLTGAERQLKYLGNKPLGEFLFKSRTMTRSALETFEQTLDNRTMFGRRSVFYLHNKPLLVSELFLPRVFEY